MRLHSEQHGQTTCPKHRKVGAVGFLQTSAAVTLKKAVPMINIMDSDREGRIDVDQAALTGESLPVTLYKDDKTLMGSTVVRGETEGTVEFTEAFTLFDKIAALLGDTEELPHAQRLVCMTVRNLTILPLFMYLIVSCHEHQIVLFMKDMTGIAILCSDKTGTLTKHEM